MGKEWEEGAGEAEYLPRMRDLVTAYKVTSLCPPNPSLPVPGGLQGEGGERTGQKHGPVYQPPPQHPQKARY